MYYISISNGLLEDDHQKRMGAAVWQYMWLIDKVTKIDDDGWGWVLGGRPIQLAQMAENMSKYQVSRNLKKLEKEGYIRIRHAPHGLIISVAKAKKRFAQNATSIAQNSKPPLRKTANLNNRNKTIQLDNNNDISVGAATAADTTNQVLNVFYKFNPTTNFGNKTQRLAVEWLVKRFGLEKTIRTAEYALSVQGKQYAPVITTPHQLKEKLSQLKIYYERQKGEKPRIAVMPNESIN